MVKYFNRTRGPVAVALKTGETTIVRPKGVLIVTPAQNGSAGLHAKVRKGIFIRLEDEPVVAPPAVESSEPPVIAEELEVESEEKVEILEVPEDSECEVPTMQWTKDRLLDYANSLDLDVSSYSTKVEILQVIEETGR